MDSVCFAPLQNQKRRRSSLPLAFGKPLSAASSMERRFFALRASPPCFFSSAVIGGVT
jgi:hypothetical protein